MVLCFCTKFHDYVLKGFRAVNHKSTSLMGLKNDRVDTIFKLKTSKGIILLKFHENILDGIKVIEQKRFSLEKFQRGIISQKL